ncbi:MAG: efflux RND transporter periplasmic adaptor subunit [Kiritimatiellae bacterium]|nr:efflux RND transporter periplasmic adaptor subunit [Kiritimatiellia bacterium]
MTTNATTIRLIRRIGLISLIFLLPIYAAEYVCPMHPQVRRPGPDSCPICGMPLVEEDEADADAPTAGLRLSERNRDLLRVQTDPVRRVQATRVLRLSGITAYDEAGVRVVTARAAGRIEHLHVFEPGETVAKGAALLDLYSPELIAAQREFLQTRETRDKLLLLGFSEAQLETLRENGTVPDQLEILSPFDGIVTERHVRAGQNVATGAPLFTLADLSKVWVYLDAYEADLAWIRAGDKVELELGGRPGETHEAEVVRVDPSVNPRTRLARVRLTLDNPDGYLVAGMFVRARLHADAGEALVVPESAPLFTGDRAVVYVHSAEDEDVYAPRVVRIGPRAQEGRIVLEGLDEGDIVVSRGAFRIDSELQIRGQPSMMTLIQPEAEVPRVDAETLSHWLEEAINVQQTLAADEWPPEHFHAMPIEGWDALVEAEDIDTARKAFEPISNFLIAVVEANGLPEGVELIKAHCPMAFDWDGADWLQKPGPLRNPYFGAEMLECGEERPLNLPAPRKEVPNGHVH